MELFTSKSLLLLLYLLGCCAGQDDILPQGPVDAKLGTNVTLTTLLDKPPYTVMFWNYLTGEDSVNVATYSDKKVTLGEGYAGRASLNVTNGFLQLGPLKSTDSGQYSLTVIGDGKTQTASTRLEVLELVTDVIITCDEKAVVEEVGTVVLKCTAKGSFLKFSWINGTEPLVIDGVRVTKEDEDLSSSVTIRDVSRSDLTGPIYCQAANNLETERSPPFNLTVYYGPEKVTITPADPPPILRAGSDYNFTCSAVSNPPADFSWLFDGKPMEHGEPTLTLASVEKLGFGRAPGKYTCEARNKRTERITVSPAVSFTVMDAISDVQVAGPTDTLIAGNSTALIGCMATVGAVESISWMKDGKPLTASDRLVFSDTKTSLTIKGLQKEDNGEYVCQMSNAVNSEKASYKLVVNYGPEAVKVEGDTAVEVNDPVMFTCSAASIPPATYTWRFNGTLTQVTMAKYVIDKAVYKNTGRYTCEAFNNVTGMNVTSVHTLSVKEEGTLDEGLSDGAIAGIVIGVIAALAAAIGLIYYCRQKVPVESPY